MNEGADPDLYGKSSRNAIIKEIDQGRLYAHVRALEIFDASKDAMLVEMIKNPEKGFYQVILMLAEAIAHEEMAVAYHSVASVVLEEIFKIFKDKAQGKSAEQFKKDLIHDIRGNLKMDEIMKEAGFADGIREAIRSQI